MHQQHLETYIRYVQYCDIRDDDQTTILLTAVFRIAISRQIGAIAMESNGKITSDVTDLLEPYGVAENRIYINFFDMPRANVGWSRLTFAGQTMTTFREYSQANDVSNYDLTDDFRLVHSSSSSSSSQSSSSSSVWKNVQLSVMSVMYEICGSSKISGSIKKKTGISTVSPGNNRCSSKQKH